MLDVSGRLLFPFLNYQLGQSKHSGKNGKLWGYRFGKYSAGKKEKKTLSIDMGPPLNKYLDAVKSEVCRGDLREHALRQSECCDTTRVSAAMYPTDAYQTFPIERGSSPPTELERWNHALDSPTRVKRGGVEQDRWYELCPLGHNRGGVTGISSTTKLNRYTPMDWIGSFFFF